MNETNQNATSQQMSLDEANKLYKEEQQKSEAERAANSRYVKIEDGEQKEFILTGIVFTELTKFKGDDEEKRMFSFELAETNAKGEHKQFSSSAKSTVTGELLKAISTNRKRVAIKRTGKGKSTTYMVITSQT